MRCLVLVFSALVVAPPVAAQDFQKGYEATRRGDFATALREWRPLAERGDVRAQINLAHLYDNGLGVRRDFAEAAKWFRAAAEQGEVQAQYNLGSLYQQGWGVRRDYVQAHLWFSLASALGDGVAGTARDAAEDKMTPAQITEAEQLAREWLERHAK